jgi:hypothetical protein
MGELSALQEFMAAALQRTRALSTQPDVAKDVPSRIAGNERLSPVEQLDIYREQFWLRHVGALEEDYKTLAHVLGHDGFHALCEAYLGACPPDSFTLRDLGARLPEFVASTAPWKEDALVVDVARYEWAFVEAFDAPAAPPLDPAAIASASEDEWSRARLDLAPMLQRVRARFPVDALRAAVQKGEAPGRPEAKDLSLCVWRGPEAMKYLDVEPAAFALLERLATGEPLAAACEAVASCDPAVGEKVGGWFQQWAALGWIAKVNF